MSFERGTWPILVISITWSFGREIVSSLGSEDKEKKSDLSKNIWLLALLLRIHSHLFEFEKQTIWEVTMKVPAKFAEESDSEF